MAISSLPSFQRKMLKRHAQTKGRGQMMRSSDISAQEAGNLFKRQVQFQGLGLTRRANQQRHKQFSKELGLRKDTLAEERSQLLPRTLMGIGTAGLSAYLGKQRRLDAKQLAAESLNRQKVYRIEDAQQRRIMMSRLGYPVKPIIDEEDM